MPTTSDKKFQSNRNKLTHRTYVEAFQIVKDKLNFKEFMFSDEISDKVNNIRA